MGNKSGREGTASSSAYSNDIRRKYPIDLIKEMVRWIGDWATFKVRSGTKGSITVLDNGCTFRSQMFSYFWLFFDPIFQVHPDHGDSTFQFRINQFAEAWHKPLKFGLVAVDEDGTSLRRISPLMSESGVMAVLVTTNTSLSSDENVTFVDSRTGSREKITFEDYGGAFKDGDVLGFHVDCSDLSVSIFRTGSINLPPLRAFKVRSRHLRPFLYGCGERLEVSIEPVFHSLR